MRLSRGSTTASGAAGRPEVDRTTLITRSTTGSRSAEHGVNAPVMVCCAVAVIAILNYRDDYRRNKKCGPIRVRTKCVKQRSPLPAPCLPHLCEQTTFEHITAKIVAVTRDNHQRDIEPTGRIKGRHNALQK